MTTTRALAAAALLVLTATLSACGGGSADRDGDGVTNEGATASAETTETYVSEIPSPDAAQAIEIQAALAAIDPSFDEEKSASRSRDMCDAILRDRAGNSHPSISLEDQVRTRYTADHLTDEQAQAVIAAVESAAWCVR